uniref:Uncharacterized protein n=1 Tax=Aegilops tauschii subsp. strangulata TaxID=200361 RepID=A0A453RQ87_AEGTS
MGNLEGAQRYDSRKYFSIAACDLLIHHEIYSRARGGRRKGCTQNIPQDVGLHGSPLPGVM